ncbi:RES family NAD+ phosphorylase [Haloferula sargassicola]|uniref:RES domain-containing protein n=1 Tax=Haloferula sargassicola TaxID=490096 RepID=A0ABP9UJV5_9BACT
MAAYFRLVQARWAGAAMSGEGARLAGGRWNPPGVPAVYLAGSRALAALEVLVHAPRELLAVEWRMIEVQVEEDEIDAAADLPDDWRDLPSSPGARRFGGNWLRSARQLALRLPSTIIPQEAILLMNPRHEAAAGLVISEPEWFRFDPRI